MKRETNAGRRPETAGNLSIKKSGSRDNLNASPVKRPPSGFGRTNPAAPKARRPKTGGYTSSYDSAMRISHVNRRVGSASYGQRRTKGSGVALKDHFPYRSFENGTDDGTSEEKSGEDEEAAAEREAMQDRYRESEWPHTHEYAHARMIYN